LHSVSCVFTIKDWIGLDQLINQSINQIFNMA